MSEPKITFSVDRQKATEGQSVTVSWSCESPDAVSLTVDNGFESTSVQLPDSGSRAIPIQKSKRKTVLTLNAVFNGKVQRESIDVKVENIKVIRPERVNYSKGGSSLKDLNPLPALKAFFSNVLEKFSQWWFSLPEGRRRLIKIILAAAIALVVADLCRSLGYQAGYERGYLDGQQIGIHI